MIRQLGLILITAIAVGCAQEVTSGSYAPDYAGEHRPFIDVETPGNGPSLDTGNGQDGSLTVTDDLVINTCVVVTAASADTMDVDDASAISSGRRLILMQMQDDFAISGPQNMVQEAGGAGMWEVARVDNVVGNTLTLETPLTNSYLTSGTVTAQACTVPEYTDVTVEDTGRLLAEPWDGSTGGFVGFYANATVTLSGEINADAAGFRGGQIFGNSGASNIEVEDTDNAQGGGKGEGLDGRSWMLEGRGAMANGAGGGNGHNAGGGGGGNGGPGGMGGKQSESFQDLDTTRGRFGADVKLSQDISLVFGGGGGAGQQDDGDSGVGGNGGGAIFLSVAQLYGDGLITSNGARGLDGGTNGSGEAGGGGGAGGTIVARTLGGSFSGILQAVGGGGGDHVSNNGNHGCGGGGGGGVILYQGLSATPDATGGPSGVNTDNGNDPWGAGPGLDGVVRDLLSN